MSPTNRSETMTIEASCAFKKEASPEPRKRAPNEESSGFTYTAPLDVFIEEAKVELGRTENTKFLPLEMYDPESELGPPEEFINSIKRRYGSAKAYSKWFYPDGSYEWKECEILGYVSNVDRFKIVWSSGNEKNVSRINLRLMHETEEEFENRLKIAGKFRDLAEIIMKYTNIIDGMTSPTVQMPLRMIEAIIDCLKSKDKDQLLKKFRIPIEFVALPASVQHNPKLNLWKNE